MLIRLYPLQSSCYSQSAQEPCLQPLRQELDDIPQKNKQKRDHH